MSHDLKVEIIDPNTGALIAQGTCDSEWVGPRHHTTIRCDKMPLRVPNVNDYLHVRITPVTSVLVGRDGSEKVQLEWPVK